MMSTIVIVPLTCFNHLCQYLIIVLVNEIFGRGFVRELVDHYGYHVSEDRGKPTEVIDDCTLFFFGILPYTLRQTEYYVPVLELSHSMMRTTHPYRDSNST